jgi:hypothetical protein
MQNRRLIPDKRSVIGSGLWLPRKSRLPQPGRRPSTPQRTPTNVEFAPGTKSPGPVRSAVLLTPNTAEACLNRSSGESRCSKYVAANLQSLTARFRSRTSWTAAPQRGKMTRSVLTPSVNGNLALVPCGSRWPVQQRRYARNDHHRTIAAASVRTMHSVSTTANTTPGEHRARNVS